MKLLLSGNSIVGIAPNITFGVFDEEIEKWRLADEEDKLLYYMIDWEYALIEDVELPADYEDGKYFFENGQFVLNEEWKPYVSTEERIAELERQLAELNGDAVWDEMAVAIEEGVNAV